MKEVICRLVVALEATDKASLQATYEYHIIVLEVRVYGDIDDGQQ
jgi:hypothetical protein